MVYKLSVFSLSFVPAARVAILEDQNNHQDSSFCLPISARTVYSGLRLEECLGQERECLLVAPVLSLFGGSVGEQGGLRAGPQPADGTKDLSGTN